MLEEVELEGEEELELSKKVYLLSWVFGASLGEAMVGLYKNV